MDMITNAYPKLFQTLFQTIPVTENKNRQFDNFVVTGGTVSCRNDNLWCRQSWQSCQIDNLLFAVVSTRGPY